MPALPPRKLLALVALALALAGAGASTTPSQTRDAARHHPHASGWDDCGKVCGPGAKKPH